MNVDTLIVGAGFGGLALAIQLGQQGFHDWLVVERQAHVGGTWAANRYPGAGCDVPSHLYSLSFAPNPHWTHEFPQQAELQAYLQGLVAQHGLTPRLRLHTEVLEARWDATQRRWQVRLRDADGERSISARVLVGATGGLSRPREPQWPGREQFRGRVLHTSRWPQDLNLRGLRVGVVGTGASSVQLVPAIVDEVAALTVFQRTPAWVISKPEREIPLAQRQRFARWPWLQRWHRLKLYVAHELRGPGFFRWPALLNPVRRYGERLLQRQVPDPQLRALLTPQHLPGCKRVLMSKRFYPALQRPHARLVPQAVSRFTADGVQCADGSEHALDVIVLATGFQAADGLTPFPIHGRDGLSLAERWQHGAQAHLGCTVAGFPNLFLIAGPNTGTGHMSFVYMIESQVRHVLAALKLLRRRGLAVAEVRDSAMARFNAQLQQRLQHSVWLRGGCQSWYRHGGSGLVTTQWPGFAFSFRWQAGRFRAADHSLS